MVESRHIFSLTKQKRPQAFSNQLVNPALCQVDALNMANLMIGDIKSF